MALSFFERQEVKRIQRLLVTSDADIASALLVSLGEGPRLNGTWKLAVAKSKFSGTAAKSLTAVYADSAGGATLDQTMVSAEGKELSMHVTLKYDGKDHPITGNPDADSVSGKAIDVHASEFTLKKGGKVVGTSHYVVSRDGKTLTVNKKGTHADGKSYDDTLVFDRQ
jgi:hypothetical protein